MCVSGSAPVCHVADVTLIVSRARAIETLVDIFAGFVVNVVVGVSGVEAVALVRVCEP